MQKLITNLQRFFIAVYIFSICSVDSPSDLPIQLAALSMLGIVITLGLTRKRVRE